MQRRTFLQGSAASIVAARFGAALAQDASRPQIDSPRGPTIIYNRQAELLRRQFEQLKIDKIELFNASPDILREFDLPRAPLETSPIRPYWDDIFMGRDFLFVQAEPLTTDVANQTNPRFQPVPVPPATRYEASPNWSGSYVHPRDGNMLIEVAGIWRLPKVGLQGGLSGASPPACSIWVGLDGQRRYFDSSLPQIGTWQQIDASGTLNYFGWYQWWVRGVPSPSKLPTVPFTLTEGDVVLCRVQASGPSSAIVSMTKFGPSPQHWSGPIAPVLPTYANRLPVISGATAEWVVERPTVLGSDELYRMPRFDPVIFFACASEEALSLAPPTQLQTLRGARFIQMFERLGDPQGISMLSKPRYLLADDRDAFRVDYIGA
jgi:hypothetical protein